MYREFLTREEAEIRFEEENQKQLESRLETFEESRKKDPLWDKKRSRNCKEFWIEKGYSLEDAIKESEKVMKEIHRKTSKKKKDNPEKYAHTYTTKIEYYLNKGYDEETAKEMLSERQVTFSKEMCIEKYGEEDGIQIWLDRQEKWQKTISKNGNLKGGYSQISQDLFNSILESYNKSQIKNVYFFTKNKEKMLRNGGFIYLYDFTDEEKKKIIEYNGDIFHANPTKFEPFEYPHPFRKTEDYRADKIWERDNNKKSLAERNGYEVLIIWDSEYRKDQKGTLDRCIKFLNS